MLGLPLLLLWPQLAKQPDPRQGPIPLDRSRSNLQQRANLFNGKPSEVAQLDYARLSRVLLLQPFKCLVQLLHFIQLFRRDGELLLHFNPYQPPPSLFRVTRPRIID